MRGEIADFKVRGSGLQIRDVRGSEGMETCGESSQISRSAGREGIADLRCAGRKGWRCAGRDCRFKVRVGWEGLQIYGVRWLGGIPEIRCALVGRGGDVRGEIADLKSVCVSEGVETFGERLQI